MNTFRLNNTSIKESIILILSNEWPLNAKQIFSRINRQYCNCFYKTVFKHLSELTSFAILKKTENKEYLINEKWLDYLNLFSRQLKEQYINARTNKYEKPIQPAHLTEFGQGSPIKEKKFSF